MLIFPYELSEHPPAPYLDIQVAPAGEIDRSISCRAKLDSGASLTVIPLALADDLELLVTDYVDVRAYDGHITTRPIYEVDIIIGSRVFSNVLVTSSHRMNVLLGRDVMNRLRLVLDGPRQRLEVHGV